MTDPDELWDPKLRAFVPRPSALWALLVGLVIGAIVGALLTVSVVHATPRPVSLPTGAGQLEVPRTTDKVDPAVQGRRQEYGIAVPHPSPTTPVRTASSVSLTGTASFVSPSFGPTYLALPEGPGRRVRICGSAACVVRTSTDAGPDLAMQRAGRVADLSFADFATVCGCDPWSVGLTRVSVERTAGPGVTVPPTDVK